MTSVGSATTCKTCGRKIAFGKLGNGKLIPLDLVAPVYALGEDGIATRAKDVVEVTEDVINAVLDDAGRIVGYYVSHFATCPQASEHSKTKKSLTDDRTVSQPEEG